MRVHVSFQVKVNGDHANGDGDDGADWGEDTSEEAVKKRMEGLGEGVKTLTFNNDLDKSIEERFNIFFNFVKVSSRIRAHTPTQTPPPPTHSDCDVH